MIHKIKTTIRNISHGNEKLKKIYDLANKIKVKSLSKLSDETYAHIKYKENTGKDLNINNPSTFNEKLWWLKLNNRDPLLTICSDKYKVREYIKELGLEHILIKLIGVYDDAREIDFEKLPEKAFIKTNHGSGTNMIWDRNKSFSKKKFIKEFNLALKENYYFQSREWNYKNIDPKIVIEEIIGEKIDTSLVDYKFLCFDGEVKFVFVELEVSQSDGKHNPFATRNIYDKEFNLIDMKVGRENFDPDLISKPKNFDKMVNYAENISKPFPHCRVDLYNVDGKIYFGETTFYHGGGTQKITPEKWNYKMGEWINLESKKIKLNM